VKKISHRQQRTVARAAEVQGVGYLTGKTVNLRFRPAPANTGVVFVRSDLGPGACIGARVENVTGTHRRTTLGDGPLCVGLVEHVLSALCGLRIDNCYIELNAPEPPGLDGSAQGFVDAILDAGIEQQAEQKAIWAVENPVLVRHKDTTLCLHPPREFELRASYLLDFGNFSPIHRQVFTSDITPETYLADVAPCRTFLLEEEGLELRKQGIGLRTQFSDLLVFGKQGPINNKLRFANEPARHKVLDLLGDLFLLGEQICGHVVAYRSGHPLNVELVKALQQHLAQVLPRQRRAA
jgi:UDP-3-O-[3-hydroxymyristoyl] N-acetylglucosamine deacetylase